VVVSHDRVLLVIMEPEKLGRGLIFMFIFIGGAGNAGGIQRECEIQSNAFLL
jgi:hypothetical protein